MPVLEMTPDAALAAMVSPEGRQNPYPFYEAIRGHGNVVEVRPGLMAAVGYDECVKALREPRMRVQDAAAFDRTFPGWRDHSSLRHFTNSMLYTNPPAHIPMRRMVTEAFTVPRIAALRSTVERMTDELLERFAGLGAAGAPVDFMTEFAFRLPVAVISHMLGVPESDQVWFREIAADIMIALEGISDARELEPANAATDQLAEYFAPLIAERRRTPGDDVIGTLVRVHEEDSDRFNAHELIGNLLLLLSAGFDTTTHLLGHGLLQALRRPVLADRLRLEPELAAGYVEETLRVEPPVQATTRWATQDIDLLGHRVPAGTKLLVILAAGNRDPRRYERPELFDPDRRDIRPLSFAGGVHICVGAPLARLEAQIALPRVLTRFPRLALGGTPTYRPRWLARGNDWLPVTTG
ncbi:cytochrome P450 [Streptomyces sp. MJM1172]|uniref:cytochrome P450 n=1 Tax=Streptomyces sp. MJM1172 TaxID=1703926 RepID=UPI0009A24FC5|nr:cytochrome P450 [Streptomyces sp. MJM1172]